jgi:hypothetical protein
MQDRHHRLCPNDEGTDATIQIGQDSAASLDQPHPPAQMQMIPPAQMQMMYIYKQGKYLNLSHSGCLVFPACPAKPPKTLPQMVDTLGEIHFYPPIIDLCPTHACQSPITCYYLRQALPLLHMYKAGKYTFPAFRGTSATCTLRLGHQSGGERQKVTGSIETKRTSNHVSQLFAVCMIMQPSESNCPDRHLATEIFGQGKETRKPPVIRYV